MIVVDDHLARVALTGRRFHVWGDEIPQVPWTMHLRLVRALIHSRTAGQLSRDVGDEVREAAANPPPELLGVLDPRPYTLMIAEIHSRRGFSVAGAELVGAAIAAEAELHIAERNLGRTWLETLRPTGLTVCLYNDDELKSARPTPRTR